MLLTVSPTAKGQKIDIKYEIFASSFGGAKFTMAEALQKLDEAGVIFDDADTLHYCGKDWTFRKKIVESCSRKDIYVHPINVVELKIDSPKTQLMASDLVAGSSWTNPLVSKTSPEQIIAQAIILASLMPKPVDEQYHGIFIGFCDTGVINMLWRKFPDGTWRWVLDIHNASSVVFSKELVVMN